MRHSVKHYILILQKYVMKDQKIGGDCSNLKETNALYKWREFCSYLLRIYIEWMFDFAKSFFCISYFDHMIFLFNYWNGGFH